jgi:hypothetical protein
VTGRNHVFGVPSQQINSSALLVSLARMKSRSELGGGMTRRGMIGHLPDNDHSVLNNKKYAIWIFVVVTIFGGGLAILTRTPFIQPHIKAPLYSPPNGCPYPPASRYWDKIPQACAAPIYEFHDTSKYGFEFLGKNTENSSFYRVGNDAVQITCRSVGQCSVERTYHDVFFQ